MAQYLGVSMEYLLTGKDSGHGLSEPIRTVVQDLEREPELLDAVCTIMHLKRGDSSSRGEQSESVVSEVFPVEKCHQN